MIVCVRELMQLPSLAPVSWNILQLIIHFEGLLEGLEFKSDPKPQSQTLTADYSRSGYDLPYGTGYKRRREQAFNNIHEPSGFVQSLKDDQLLGLMSLLLKRQTQRHRNLDAIKATHGCVTITPDDHGGKGQLLSRLITASIYNVIRLSPFKSHKLALLYKTLRSYFPF
jgi:hypothetical protein